MKPIPYSFFHRLGCAWKGILNAIYSERHVRVHMIFFGLVVLAGWLTCLAPWEWMGIMVFSALVISMELINASLEKMLDHLHPGYHVMIGQAKDMAAGAVLVSVILSVIFGLWIFLPKWIG